MPETSAAPIKSGGFFVVVMRRSAAKPGSGTTKTKTITHMHQKKITLEIRNQGKAAGTLGWLLEQEIKIEIERKTFLLNISNEQVKREALAAIVTIAGKSQVIAIEGLQPARDEESHPLFCINAHLMYPHEVGWAHLTGADYRLHDVTYTKAADDVLQKLAIQAKDELVAFLAERDEEEASFGVELTLTKLEPSDQP